MIPSPRHPRRRTAIAAAVTVGAMLMVSAGPLLSPAAAGAATPAAAATGTPPASPARDTPTAKNASRSQQAKATKPTVHTVTLITGDIVTVTSVGGGHSN